MNVIVGDKVIIQRYRRTGTKYYLAKVIQISPGVPDPLAAVTPALPEVKDKWVAHLETILNADTGKKYKRKEQALVGQLISLEEFIDGKRALIKELEAYL